MDMKPFLTIKEAAELTGLSQFYLRKRCREGSLPVLRVGKERTGTYFLHKEKLLRQLEEESGSA